MAQPKNIALAYSGGLDTSVIIPWLKERYPGVRVVAVVADVGQGDDFDQVKDKARRSGADAVHVVDVRRIFVTDYIWPVLRADAIYEGRYLLGTSMARPLIARVQVEAAVAEGCDALAHGCTGKGNDQVRFELTYQALAPRLAVIAPVREWSLGSREEEIDYARAHGVPVPVTHEKPYSMDGNLWHQSYEAGILEDPWAEPPADMFRLTVDPARAPDAPEYVEIGFEAGTPVAIDGRQLDAVELVASLNKRAGAHGVGRVDIVENRLVGMKSRGVYETPGGAVLVEAHHHLQTITLDRETQHFKELVAPRYAELVYYGQWYSPLRRALDAFVASTQRTVTGTVRVKLYKGTSTVVGRRAARSVYSYDLATFGRGAGYDQKDAEGFIRLFGLPTRVYAAANPESTRDESPISLEIPAGSAQQGGGRPRR
ncbi:MAG TPA: argininosuccinate synthase [bacterium]|nr:argininosuccinate synthase [bacterium]